MTSPPAERRSPMTNYVADYRRLDDNAARDESQAEQYRKRADENRWEQCRIAYEATTEGGYSFKAFAEAVGVVGTTVSRQARMWAENAEAAGAHDRPSYAEAWRDVTGDQRTTADDTRGRARNLPATERAKLAAELLADKDVAEQVVTDKQARHNITRAADQHYQRQATERTERTERKAAGDPTDQRVDALLQVNRLGEACERFSRDGNDALRHVGPLPDSERYWLTGSVERAETTVRAARRYLELGDSEINTELADLLDNEA